MNRDQERKKVVIQMSGGGFHLVARTTRVIGRILAMAASLALVMSSFATVRLPAIAPTSGSPDGVALTSIGQLGGLGNAGLYGWGAATLNHGSVPLGDSWNTQIQHPPKCGKNT